MLTSYGHALRPDLTVGDYTDWNISLFQPENIEGAAVLVEERWDTTTAVLAGNALDCERRQIEHAAAVLSSTSGTRTFVDGARVYYGAPGPVPIAVLPADRGDTNNNGLYAIFGVPPGDDLYMQVWGFPDEDALAEGEAGLVLVGEQPLHAVADAVIQVLVWSDQ
jgi:hypothetical protein